MKRFGYLAIFCLSNMMLLADLNDDWHQALKNIQTFIVENENLPIEEAGPKVDVFMGALSKALTQSEKMPNTLNQHYQSELKSTQRDPMTDVGVLTQHRLVSLSVRVWPTEMLDLLVNADINHIPKFSLMTDVILDNSELNRFEKEPTFSKKQLSLWIEKLGEKHRLNNKLLEDVLRKIRVKDKAFFKSEVLKLLKKRSAPISNYEDYSNFQSDWRFWDMYQELMDDMSYEYYGQLLSALNFLYKNGVPYVETARTLRKLNHISTLNDGDFPGIECFESNQPSRNQKLVRFQKDFGAYVEAKKERTKPQVDPANQ